MDKSRQAEISVALGTVIFGFSSAAIVAYLKREVPVTPLLLLAATGLTFVLVGMIYGRIVNKVECLFCEAIVPRFYTSPNADGKKFICAVCQGARNEYPIGSENIPQKKPCAACKRMYYPLPHLYMTDGGRGQSVCRRCLAVGTEISKELKRYAAEKGVDLTDAVAEEWARSQISGMRRSKIIKLAPIVAAAMIAMLALMWFVVR